MSNEKKNADLAALLAPVVEEAGLYLEDVRLVSAGKHTSCRVTVDLPSGPGGVDSTQLADVSRAISATLDESDPISSAYTLEVSTPGADRKLTEPRHFSRATGRLVAITLNDGDKVTGRVAQTTDTGVVLDSSDDEVEFDHIKKAHVVVELKKMDGDN